MTMISIDHLSRNYGPLVAVDDVSLGIEKGEVVGLLGHNGAGKTTVMKILTGFLEPSSGTVRVGGDDVQREREAVQRRIGYLPENAPLYPEMVVQDYLAMIAELRELPPEQIERAVAEAAVATGLEQHLTTRIGTLSKGYRQRVGLAQAIVHKPDVLVLDEPTNGLDPTQIRAIRALILRLARDTTIILSTHILQEIEAVCDRVLVMIQGRLAADGSLESLLAQNQVALSLERGDVADQGARLSGVAGITSATSEGPDPEREGFTLWRLDYEAAQAPVPELITLCQEAGWAVASAAPVRASLERLFEDLQSEAAARSGEASA